MEHAHQPDWQDRGGRGGRWRDLFDAMYGDTISYSNTRPIVTGPDRFLVLYTDFKYGGECRKAIVVQEVVVEAKGR